jgi:hypothetical protein
VDQVVDRFTNLDSFGNVQSIAKSKLNWAGDEFTNSESFTNADGNGQ